MSRDQQVAAVVQDERETDRRRKEIAYWKSGKLVSIANASLIDQIERLRREGWEIELSITPDIDPLTADYNDASKLVQAIRARRRELAPEVVTAYLSATPTPRVDTSGKALVVPERTMPLDAGAIEYCVHDGRAAQVTEDIELGFLFLGAHLERLVNAVTAAMDGRAVFQAP